MTESPDGPARKSNLSITSLALALVALAVFWSEMVAAFFEVRGVEGAVYIVAVVAGFIFGVGAVVTGVIARRRVRRGDAGRGGVARAGIVLGVVAAVVPAILLALVVYGVFYGYEEFQECIKGSGSAYPNYLCLK
jgi:heme/copper-type cytochrome/quinol oxidase subunit 2